MRSVVITGVSAGIGKATAELLVKSGYRVFGSVRKNSDGKSLKKHFGNNFTPLYFDVKDLNAIKSAANAVEKSLEGQNLTALVNNAGVAVLGPLQYLDINEFREQIEVKVLGTLACTQIFLPLLGTNPNRKGPPGKIINVSSALGGRIGAPFYGAYCSSKHALEGLSETLRRELMIHDIKVSIIAPGAIRTKIWDKVNLQIELKKYHKTEYYHQYNKALKMTKNLGEKGLPVEKVAKKILCAIEDKKPKIKYFLFGEGLLMLIYFIPKRLLDYQFSKFFGLRKNK